MAGRKAASSRRAPKSRQLTTNSSEKNIGGGLEPPLFRFPQPSANRRRRFETHASQETHRRLDCRACEEDEADTIATAVRRAHKNHQTFGHAAFPEME